MRRGGERMNDDWEESKGVRWEGGQRLLRVKVEEERNGTERDRDGTNEYQRLDFASIFPFCFSYFQRLLFLFSLLVHTL